MEKVGIRKRLMKGGVSDSKEAFGDFANLVKAKLAKKSMSVSEIRDYEVDAKAERGSRPVTARSEQRIRWDNDHIGVKNTHWNEICPSGIMRKANDQTIQLMVDKPMLPKRKGEWVHTPLGKIHMDIGSLFMGEIEVGARFCKLILVLGALLKD